MTDMTNTNPVGESWGSEELSALVKFSALELAIKSRLSYRRIKFLYAIVYGIAWNAAKMKQ